MMLLGMIGERHGIMLLVCPVKNRNLLFILRRFWRFLKYGGCIFDIFKDITLKERMSCRLGP